MSLSTDQPKTERLQDRFQRYEFSKRIANMIALNTSGNSLVVGLYGKWGEGKTSVMNFIKNELPADCIVVNFNPWLFSDQEHLLKAFFNEIAVAFNKSIKTIKENIGELLSNYGSLIGSIKIAGFGASGLNNVGEKWMDVSVESLKQRVDQIIKDSEKKVVVFVDDIDRLDVKEIQYLFKLIKLVGDFSDTAYVLAFDDDLVASALAPLYGDGHKSTGYQFLEKIIQVPLIIPKATKMALVKYTMELLDEMIKKVKVTLTEDNVQKFRTVFDENFIPAINNPRLAIRYTNSLYFSLPLLTGEVSITDLMLVEALKVFYPQAYDFMRANSPIFLTDNLRQKGAFRPDSPDKGTIANETKAALESLEEKEKRRIFAIWRELFPQYNSSTANHAYAEDSWKDWYREKRICSGKYFERYFTYAVIEGDISDVFFDQFLKDLENFNLKEAKERMAMLFEQTALKDTIFKLRLWEDRLNERQSEKLSELLASIESELPVEPGEFGSFTTRAEGAKIIAQLIINLDKKKRIEQAIKIFNITANLEAAMEINYWLFYKNEKQVMKYFTFKDEQKIRRYFLDHFQTVLNEENFFDLLSDGNLWRIMIWWSESDKKGLQEQIIRILRNDSGKAIQLIKVFAATITSWGGPEGSNTYKGGFNESRYDSMAQLIEPSVVYQILNSAGKYRLRNISLTRIDDQEKMNDSELANIYLQFYEKKHLTLGDV